MNVLEIKNLTKKYGSLTAVDNLSIKIGKGSVFGILGPNGSGKTTTLSCILGIIYPTSGTFCWFEKSDGTIINNEVGAIIEQPNFYPYLSAHKNLEFVAKIKKINQPQTEILNVLDRVGLLSRKDDIYSHYSFGMKRRLALAATLLGNPEVLIFDEPTNGLDPEGISFVRNLIIEEAKKGKTIILASHILDEVEKVCNEVLILKNGKLIAFGKVSEILKDERKIVIISDNNLLLHELLIKNQISEKVEFNNDELIFALKPNIDIKEISKIAMENKILITKLEVKKKSLEAEFLDLIK